MTSLANVSRETMDKLEIYTDLLKKWNPKINLVAKSTLDSVWERHIEDSLQVISHIPDGAEKLVDMGSGGGFPGLVIAINALSSKTPQSVTLIESDQRKSAFLRTVLRETGAEARVMTNRIENIEPQDADVLTARALADLTTLLEFADLHLAPSGKALFLKGRNWKEEVSAAQEFWQFQWNATKSLTNPDAVVLEIKEISRV